MPVELRIETEGNPETKTVDVIKNTTSRRFIAHLAENGSRSAQSHG
jgi:hypothetical protein